MKEMTNKSKDVTDFLERLNHPLRKEIELLRGIILAANKNLSENIKWNGPNYSHHNEDRITMKIHPPTTIQLIFHRGAKKQIQPKNRLIQDQFGLLTWKENDRAIATFKDEKAIKAAEDDLKNLVCMWIDSVSSPENSTV